MSAFYTCPVCGYPELTEAPRTESGGGSYEICASCGFEFGFTDEDRGFTYETWRQAWVERGMPWRGGSLEPQSPGWDPRQQLADLVSGENS